MHTKKKGGGKFKRPGKKQTVKKQPVKKTNLASIRNPLINSQSISRGPSSGQTIFLYIATHGGFKLKHHKTRTVTSGKTVGEIHDTLVIPKNIVHINKVTHGKYGCLNYTFEPHINDVTQLLIKGIYAAKIDKIITDNREIDKTMTNNLEIDAIFAKICSESYKVMRNSFNRYISNRDPLKLARVKNYINISHKFTTNIYNKSNRKNQNRYFINKHYEYNIDDKNRGVFILYDSGGPSKPVGDDIKFHINTKNYGNGKIGFSTKDLLQKLSSDSYTNIYIFDDSCNNSTNINQPYMKQVNTLGTMF